MFHNNVLYLLLTMHQALWLVGLHVCTQTCVNLLSFTKLNVSNQDESSVCVSVDHYRSSTIAKCKLTCVVKPSPLKCQTKFAGPRTPPMTALPANTTCAKQYTRCSIQSSTGVRLRVVSTS